VAVTVPAYLLSLVLSWYYQPYLAADNQTLGLIEYSPFFPGLFDLRGVAFAAGGVLREHYLTPLVTSSLSLPGSAWVLGQWWTKGGVTLSSSTMHNVINSAWEAVNPPPPGGGAAGGAGKDADYLAVLRYLTRHGYTQWTRYQPASRFWPLQWVEGGWLLVLAAALIAATVWLVRRRAA
jgi:hypothetical protein